VGGNKIDIFNIYMPSVSASANFNLNFNLLFDIPNNDSLFFGDFNPHHPEWCASLSDNRGTSFSAAVDNEDLWILNFDTPTRIPSAAKQSPSSPDVTLASAHLVPSVTWETLTTLNSDHLPIKVILQRSGCPPRLQYSFTNFHKADWAGYVKESEKLISKEHPPRFLLPQSPRVKRSLVRSSALLPNIMFNQDSEKIISQVCPQKLSI
jgi:hypothetical protein